MADIALIEFATLEQTLNLFLVVEGDGVKGERRSPVVEEEVPDSHMDYACSNLD